MIVHRVKHLIDIADTECPLHAAAGGQMLPVLPLIPIVQKEDSVPFKSPVIAIMVLVPEIICNILHILLPALRTEPILFHCFRSLHRLAESHQHNINMAFFLRFRYVLAQVLFFLIGKYIRIIVYPLCRSFAVGSGSIPAETVRHQHHHTEQHQDPCSDEPKAEIV